MAELTGLVVDVEARIDKLERGLKRANQLQSRGADQMERRAKQSADKLRTTYGRAGDSIAAVLKKLGPSLVAGLGIGALSGLTAELRGVVRGVAEIGDEAKRAGVSVQAFQELRYVSEQNRVGVDAMVDGLKELSLRADEFIVTGSGPAAEAFKRINLGAAQLAEGLKKPDQLFLDIVGKLEDLDDAARIRIADEIFGGTGGEQFVQLIGQGEDALRATILAGRDAGAVMDAELIRKAEELDRRFQALETRVGNFGKALAVGLADAAVKIATLRTDLDDLFSTPEQAAALLGDGTAAALARDTAALEAHKTEVEAIRTEYFALADAAAGLTGPLYQTAATLGMYGELDAAGELNRIATKITGLASDMDTGTVSAEEFETRMTELAAQAQTALGELDAIDAASFGGVTSALNGFIARLGDAVTRARELRKALPGASPTGEAAPAVYGEVGARGDPRSFIPPSDLAPVTSVRPVRPGVDSFPAAPATPAAPAASGGGGGGGGASRPRESDYRREIASIAEEAAELRILAAELEKVTAAEARHGNGMEVAAAKAELLAAAQRSGVAVTPELTAQIDTMAQGYVDAGMKAEEARNRIEGIRQATDTAIGGMAGIFGQMAAGALTAKQATAQLIMEVLKLIAQRMILNSLGGPNTQAGGIATAILGGFASGGYTGNGGKYEPAGIVHKGEYVLSKSATSAIGIANLDALHSAARSGYSGGGLVGATGSAMKASSGSNSASAAPTINISAPVTVNASGGTPAQNDDLAKKTSKALREELRGLIVGEIVNQMRPGNALGAR